MNEHHEFRPAQRPDKRSDRPEGRFEARTDGKPERPRRSLRETGCDIDRDILRMLMRRHNLIKRMYNAKGFLEPAEEKSIRESWEAAVSRVSRDPRLSGRFFTLMQEVEFLPRPGEDGEAQRPAFNLAPADMPVRLSMPAPRSCRLTRAWATLAACTGQAVRIAPALMNDPVVDCVKLLNQLGAHANRDDGAVHVAAGTPLGTPDKVLHVGDSSWNFYLALGHYLGRPSRTKFTGGAALKLADLSATRRFLPLMGARLVHVVPKSDGFPVRIECSGVLPGKVVFPADAPVELAEGIMLAAPSYERAITLDLSAMPERALAFARILPVLNAAGADVRREGDVLHFQPCALSIPSEPTLPVEPELAVFLMGLAPALGGEVRLEGQWPTWPGTEAGLDLLRQTGAKVECSATEILARSLKPLAELPAAWNAKYKEYLGLDVPDDAQGCLQDVHWTQSYGYFPSYALGSAYGAQILAAMEKDFDVFAAVREGKLTAVRDWLKEHVFSIASVSTPDEWIRAITGEPLDPDYFLTASARKSTNSKASLPKQPIP